MINKPLIVIAGPTASGKTDLAIRLALKFDTEIISADSRLVYREFNIGTAKPTSQELQMVKHHFIDIVDPDFKYTVSHYRNDASKLINDLHEQNKIPIIAGGTGFYIRSIIDGLDIPPVEPDEAFRNELKKMAQELGNTIIFKKLKEVDVASSEKLHPNDTYRIIRALEVFKQTGKPISQLQTRSGDIYQLHYFCLSSEDRDYIYNRINQRVLTMIEIGLIEEVKYLLQKYGKTLSLLKTLGYKETIEYLEGECSYLQMIEDIQKNTRHFARRQLIWFRPDTRIKWYHIDKMSQDEILQDVVKTIKQND